MATLLTKLQIGTKVLLAALAFSGGGPVLPVAMAADAARPTKEAKPRPEKEAEVAQKSRSIPEQDQPQFGLASMNRDGVITILAKTTIWGRVDRHGPGGVHGVDMVRRECVRASRFKRNEVQVFITGGKRISKVAPKRLAELLKEQTPVLVTPPGEEIDPFYAQLLKEGSLVIVPPKGARDP